MIVEYKLNGSITTHQGTFDTTGFWIRFEEESETTAGIKTVVGYKLYNHGSFAFYHTDREVVEKVYYILQWAVAGVSCSNETIKDIGYIQVLGK